jgi:tetratricopeptide (TPR) repeat protein
VELLYILGVAYGHDMQNYQRSEKYFHALLKIDKNHLKALKDLAVVYGMTKRFEESAEVLQKVVQLDPDDASAWYNLGLSLNAVNRIEEAQKAFNKSHQIDPSRKRVVVKR